MPDDSRNHGTQPLDAIMTHWSLSNHQLVKESYEQLNHKQVQKARKGRQLTLHMMMKITRQLNETIHMKLGEEAREQFEPYIHKHLFNYSKGFDPAWHDPNLSLYPQ